MQEALPVLEAMKIPPAAPGISESIEAMKERVPQRAHAARDVGRRRLGWSRATKSLDYQVLAPSCCLQVQSVSGDSKMREFEN